MPKENKPVDEKSLRALYRQIDKELAKDREKQLPVDPLERILDGRRFFEWENPLTQPYSPNPVPQEALEYLAIAPYKEYNSRLHSINNKDFSGKDIPNSPPHLFPDGSHWYTLGQSAVEGEYFWTSKKDPELQREKAREAAKRDIEAYARGKLQEAITWCRDAQCIVYHMKYNENIPMSDKNTRRLDPRGAITKYSPVVDLYFQYYVRRPKTPQISNVSSDNASDTSDRPGNKAGTIEEQTQAMIVDQQSTDISIDEQWVDVILVSDLREPTTAQDLRAIWAGDIPLRKKKRLRPNNEKK